MLLQIPFQSRLERAKVAQENFSSFTMSAFQMYLDVPFVFRLEITARLWTGQVFLGNNCFRFEFLGFYETTVLDHYCFLGSLSFNSSGRILVVNFIMFGELDSEFEI